MQDLLMLWDAIFADGIGFDLVDYIFVAMMLYIRDLRKFSLWGGNGVRVCQWKSRLERASKEFFLFVKEMQQLMDFSMQFQIMSFRNSAWQSVNKLAKDWMHKHSNFTPVYV